MTQHYQHIMVALDGSKSAELALHKAIHVALRNQAQLFLVHVVDTRAIQSVTPFDSEVYEQLKLEAQKMLGEYEEQAHAAGLTEVHQVIEYGNPKTLLATDIPDEHEIDLIMVGATGLNAFERLLVGSSSEYILRHAKVDFLVVRDQEDLF